jgi:putative endonuclease
LPTHRSEVGRRGEQAVAGWYGAQGFSVLARNWRCSSGELDLVLLDPGHDVVVFCEVKTRTSSRFGSPLESVTKAKQRRLRALAGRWMAEARPPGLRAQQIRLDLAAVRPGPGGTPVVDVVQIV